MNGKLTSTDILFMVIVASVLILILLDLCPL